jgi:hypothetical protein
MAEWRYSSIIVDLGNRWRVRGQLHDLSGEEPPGTHWIAGLDPQSVWTPCRESNPVGPARSQWLYRLMCDYARAPRRPLGIASARVAEREPLCNLMISDVNFVLNWSVNTDVDNGTSGYEKCLRNFGLETPMK